MDILGDLKFRLATARRARELEAELNWLREHNECLQHQMRDLNAAESRINSTNIVWIFGTGRTGSSWLWRMLVSQKRRVGWNEPYAGSIFSRLDTAENLKKRKETIFGYAHRDAWRASVKGMILRGAAARFPQITKDDYLIIKEPNGSSGAHWLAEALPECRIIVLVRDPRDVVASAIDSVKPRAWRTYSPESQMSTESLTRTRSEIYRGHIAASLTAFDLHEGPKSLISYEELIAAPLNTMKRLHNDIELPTTIKSLESVIEKYSWQNIPDEKKGEGKAMRKATPGGWRVDLSQSQVQTVEEITGDLMERLGYEKVT